MEPDLAKELIAARKGQTKSWAVLIRAFTPTLERWATRWTQNKEEAEDAVQDFWLHCIEKSLFSKTRAESIIQFRNYLITSLRNRILQRARRTRIETEYIRSIEFQMQENLLRSVFDDVAASSSEMLWMEKHLQDSFEEFLLTCSPRQRSVLYLVMDGYANKEIAEILSIPPNTVASDIYRARQRLSQSLHNEGARE